MKIAFIEIARFIYIFIQVFASIHFLIPLLLVLFFFIKKALDKGKKLETVLSDNLLFKFGVIITAYKESIFLPPIIDSLLKQTYTNIEIYVVADRCDVSGLIYTDARIHILSPPEPLNSNVRSIQYAIDHFTDDIEVLTLFDPDNLVHAEFFAVQNQYFNRGYQAVQAAIWPKNTAGYYARMDSIGSKFYGFIDRSARSLLGLSVNIWGCGFSVLTQVYKNIDFDDRSDMGGFDKHMQVEITLNVPQIAYAPDSILYDEKITDHQNLENQRIRWINSYFKFFRNSWDLLATGIKRKNFNLFFFGFNLLRPPYFIQLIAGIVCMLINLVFFPLMFVYWIICFLLFLISIFLILLTDHSVKIIDGLIYLPLFLYYQIKSLLKLKINKGSVLQTSHYQVLYIEDMLKQ